MIIVVYQRLRRIKGGGVGINQQKLKVSVQIVNVYITVMYFCSSDARDMYIPHFYLVENINIV